MVVTEQEPGRVLLHVDYPAHLHDEVASHGLTGMLRVVTELAGGRDVVARCASTGELRSEFEVRYG